MLPGMENASEVEVDRQILEITTRYCSDEEPGCFFNEDPKFSRLLIRILEDKNSSFLRQSVTCLVAGLTESKSKHGYDAFYKDPETEKTTHVEVKPVRINEGEKVANSGNFNDLTPKLLEDKKNWDVVCSAFNANCKLIYVVRFPMLTIYEHLKSQAIAAKQKKKARSVCSFTYKNYDDPKTDVLFLSEMAQNYLPFEHYSMLQRRNKNSKYASGELYEGEEC
jgi:hypothetical protein